MAPLGGGTATLRVGTVRVGGGVGVLATGGTGELGGGVIVGVGIQFVKILRSFETAVSCLWWMAARASLIIQERRWRAWTMRSLSLTVGLVRYFCRN